MSGFESEGREMEGGEQDGAGETGKSGQARAEDGEGAARAGTSRYVWEGALPWVGREPSA